MPTFTFNRVAKTVIVDAPDTEVTVTELYDACQDWLDEPSQMTIEAFISATGGQSLGGGEFVGTTVLLVNDWRVGFEQRTTHKEDGTATSADATGTTLIDTAATFVTNGVTAGDIVTNYTDESHATITNVVSETELVHTPLDGGTDNDWDLADSHNIHPVIPCVISGGNLVAVNVFSDNPIFPTFGTQVVIRQSAAPVQLVQSSTRVGTFVSG